VFRGMCLRSPSVLKNVSLPHDRSELACVLITGVALDEAIEIFRHEEIIDMVGMTLEPAHLNRGALAGTSRATVYMIRCDRDTE